MDTGTRILFSEQAIAQRVVELADEIAAARVRPNIAVPILAGAFVFAADLLRALVRKGLSLPVEFIWLNSYGAGETANHLTIRAAPPDLRGKHVLLIDGVLDSGGTLAEALRLLRQAHAESILSVALVAKAHPTRRIEADFIGFQAGREFLFGYGMDRGGGDRALPDIRIVEKD